MHGNRNILFVGDPLIRFKILVSINENYSSQNHLESFMSSKQLYADT